MIFEMSSSLKRSLVFLLSLGVALFVGFSLLQSWSQPQVQDRLAIAQTYLVLQSSELGVDSPRQSEKDSFTEALLGNDPYQNALEQYQPLLKTVTTGLTNLEGQLSQSEAAASGAETAASADAVQSQIATLQAQRQKQASLLMELQTEAGILHAVQGELPEAQSLWQAVQRSQPSAESGSSLGSGPGAEPRSGVALLQPLPAQDTAAVLAGLWSDPPRLLPETDSMLKQGLRGWFEDEALARLYTLDQRQDELQTLNAQRQIRAQEAIAKLALVILIPLVGAIVGTILILIRLVQAWKQRQEKKMNPFTVEAWSVPWDGAILAIGVLGGFFLVGQIIMSSLVGSIILAIAQQLPLGSPIRAQALGVFGVYSLMAIAVLFFLSTLLRPYRPLPPSWFRLNLREGHWFAWGLGGYFAAYPLVLLVSVLNQHLWDGQGGSNPLLTLALENQDNIALVLFLVTAAIAAPLFEEIFFRGFLMASLTRFMPGWGAILVSAFIFAAAHLSLSELLPLMTLGAMLGFVYGRSRNLLASILLHGLWNSGTLVSLLLFGSALRG